MKTLLSFGDSHTAGAEIDAAWSSECKEKAYPQRLLTTMECDLKTMLYVDVVMLGY